MAGTVTQLKAVSVSDIQTDIENTMSGRERVLALVTTLESKRRDDQLAFLKTFAADLAAVKGDPDKAFSDAQFTKYTTWKGGDDDLVKRIEALRAIGHGLAARIREFAAAYRDEVIAYLTAQIDAIAAQLAVEKSAGTALTERKRELQDELDDLTGAYAAAAKGAAGGAAAAPAKKAAAKRKGAKKP